jgi:hypothetical protein
MVAWRYTRTAGFCKTGTQSTHATSISAKTVHNLLTETLVAHVVHKLHALLLRAWSHGKSVHKAVISVSVTEDSLIEANETVNVTLSSPSNGSQSSAVAEILDNDYPPHAYFSSSSWTAADSSGDWTFDYTGTTLPEGNYAFTGTASRDDVTSVASKPYLVTVDLTAPTVTVTVDATTPDTTPEVRVDATDLVALPDTDDDTAGVQTTVTLDVDLNNDGDFSDADETDAITGTLTDGLGMLSLAPISVGNTVRVRARVTDSAGNEGTSNTSSVEVVSSTLDVTDVTALSDPNNGQDLLRLGNLHLLHALDLDLSPDTTVGLSPALSYNSDRVSVQPIIQAEIQTANNPSRPA